MQTLACLFLLGLANAVSGGKLEVSEDQRWLLEKRTNEQSISLIRLIANPEAFDAKYVVVQGYLVLSDDYEHSLFLDENAYRVGLTANTVAVDLADSSEGTKSRAKEKDRKYVIVAGRFKAGPTAFSGGRLEAVYRIFSTVDAEGI